MATISYVNDALPIGGRNFNPAFEEMLDTTPAVGDYTSNLYEIVNNDGGLFNGFKVQFTSNINGGAGDFTYTNVGAELKPSGTITGMLLRAPNGTVIAQVTTGTSTTFGNAKLQDFYARLTNANAETSADAIFMALDGLFNSSSAYSGSPVADHLTSYGNGTGEMFGNAGDDVLWSRGYASRKLVGGAGNDVIRVEDANYEVHGGNADGSGGAGTDTLEIVGYVDQSTYTVFKKFTNIDVLRFVAGDAPTPGSLGAVSIDAVFDLNAIGAANLPSTLIVHGSTASYTENEINVYTVADQAATKGVTIDLSGWTFKTWNEERNEVNLATNSAAKILNDVVIGSMVADNIYTYYGEDTLRGGGGADALYGGAGNDTFIYGLNEAADGEFVNGGYGPKDGTADKVLILADNDFTGVHFVGIDQFVFGGAAKGVFSQNLIDATGAGAESVVLATTALQIVGNAAANSVVFKLEKTGVNPGIDLSVLDFRNWSNNDSVTVLGTASPDTIIGSAKSDTINGAAGGDTLQGNAGADSFVFDAGLGAGVDHIADFRRKEGDRIHLDDAMFTRLKPGALKKKAFEIGDEADSKKDRVIYDKKDGTLRYDDDGSGKHKPVIIGILDDAAKLKAGDILVI